MSACPPPAPFTLTPLVGPASEVTPTPPAGFDAGVAALLGACCNLTYTQFAAGNPQITPQQIAAALPASNTYALIGNGLTLSEPIASADGGSDLSGEAGLYVTVPIGFALKVTPASGPAFNVIALRGTRTYAEWITDVDAIPAPFVVGSNNGQYYTRLSIAPLGMVHGGFYDAYTRGSDGAEPQKVLHDLDTRLEYTRPAGSIAQQIQALVGNSGFDSSLALYVTGHSLGGALATLCAMDLGTNFPKSFPAGKLFMYSLASPLVAAGVTTFSSTLSVPTGTFVSAYNQAVPVSWRVVHAADLVPILPPPCTQVSSDLEASVQFAHVTANVVTFCAQTGSIGGNHSCSGTYVPYLKLLAAGFRS